MSRPRKIAIQDVLTIDSFAKIISYTVPKGIIHPRWYIKPDIHRAFQPEESEREQFRAYPHLVTSCLIAMSVEASLPSVHLFNPSLVEPDPPPPPIKSLRPLTEEDDWEDQPPTDEEGQEGQENDPKQQKSEAGGDEIKIVTTEMDVDLPENGQDGPAVHVDAVMTLPENQPNNQASETVLSIIDRLKLQPRNVSSPSSAPPSKSKAKQGSTKPKNPTLAPWLLNVRDWKNIKKASQVAKSNVLEKSVVQAVAISPRGAKWIVAVGDAETIFVFRQQD